MSTLLEEAFELVKNQETWTTKAYARDSEGFAVKIASPGACKFCSEGAVRKTAQVKNYTKPEYFQAMEALDAAAVRIYGKSTLYCNDRIPHEKVLEIWQEAMK